ncbi:CHAT domain-containing protein [Glycomyces harbinensis]|uniref:CHAT domain-containing protein n=1 Tax=Glycomyces harbinensis TaxID=58114 RepID=A0A1G6XQ08_9ACTN|nr:CHAT domain-containing protein [Glycomyces harbinensis]SDD80268.1 CHAT domain-containing protein [Glycomyces harbinensis]
MTDFELGPGMLSPDQRLALAREWDELLDEIQGVPGFEDFLRPPSYEALLPASAEGPVIVVNVSRWRCDALIVTSAGVATVPLPGLSLEDAHDRLVGHLHALEVLETAVQKWETAKSARREGDHKSILDLQSAGRARGTAAVMVETALGETCEWLWDAVVAPVLPYLPIPEVSAESPRVWWCPTGPLALLPIHAAGRGDDWLADMVVSSYTPTLRGLVEARSRDVDRAAARDRFLLASTMPEGAALGEGPLAGLDRTDLIDCSTREATLAGLSEARYVHFHCHADQNLQDPAQGGFQLDDDVIRVFDLAELALRGEFAGLAACKTAVGGTELLDESITLAAALHYSGFRHVVGGLWIVAEDAAASVFSSVYTELAATGRFLPDESARALATAVNDLRRSGEELHRWAPFIHIGP